MWHFRDFDNNGEDILAECDCTFCMEAFTIMRFGVIPLMSPDYFSPPDTATTAQVDYSRQPYVNFSTELVDSVPLVKLSPDAPSEECKRFLMYRLFSILTGNSPATPEAVEIIAAIILLAPPACEADKQTPVLKSMTKLAGVEYKTISLPPVDVKRLDNEVKKDTAKRSVPVNNRRFLNWFFKEASVDDALAYFAAICLVLLRGHDEWEIKSSIGENLHLNWRHYSKRPGPPVSFGLNNFGGLCNLLGYMTHQRTQLRRGILKMVIAHYLDALSNHTTCQHLKRYTSELIVKPFRFVGFQNLKLVERVFKMYRTIGNIYALPERSCELTDFKNSVENCIKAKAEFATQVRINEHQIGDKKYKVNFWPYARVFEPRCLRISVEDLPYLYALSAGLLDDEEAFNIPEMRKRGPGDPILLRFVYEMGRRIKNFTMAAEMFFNT